MKKEQKKYGVKIVVGSWEAYNNCNKRALGSSWLDLDEYNTYDKIINKLKKEGFTASELEETFIQDYEQEGFDDIHLFGSCDCTSISQALEDYENAKKELLKMEEKKQNATKEKSKFKLDSLQFIENEEDICKIKCALYGDDYIENLKQQDLKFYKSILKDYLYFKTEDGYIFGINNEFSKPRSNLYYSDEYDCPDNTLDNFLNEHSDYRYLEKRCQDLKKNFYYYILSKLNCATKNCKLNGKDYEILQAHFGGSCKDMVRLCTEKEENDLLKVNEFLKNEYKERLTKYFNRYKDKIRYYSYWANR